MLFKDSFITDAGAQLLARATAQAGKLIWTRAATSNANTDSDSVVDMNALTDITKTAADSYTSSGAVTNAIVNDERTSVSIYAELTNEDYEGEARTFGAWAKIEGDEGDVLAIVARCGGATPTTINPASEGVVKAFVDFTLQISAEQAQAVAVGEEYYATAAALQSERTAREALAGRVVTTHSAASDETGEAQTILGAKTFSDDVTITGNIIANTQGKSATFKYVEAYRTVSTQYYADDDYRLKKHGETDQYRVIITRNTTDPNNAVAIVQNCKVNAYSVTTRTTTTGTIIGEDGEDMQEGEKLLEINADEITLNNGTWLWFGDSNAGLSEDEGDIVLQPATGKNAVLQGDGAFKGRLDGLIPHVHYNAAQTDLIKPVGAIVLLAVERISAITTPTGIIAGSTIESGTDWQLSEATLQRDSSTGGIKMLAPALATITGKFVAMSGTTFSTQYESQLILAIKIAEAQ